MEGEPESEVVILDLNFSLGTGCFSILLMSMFVKDTVSFIQRFVVLRCTHK